jgi:hypothetical protein
MSGPTGSPFRECALQERFRGPERPLRGARAPRLKPATGPARCLGPQRQGRSQDAVATASKRIGPTREKRPTSVGGSPIGNDNDDDGRRQSGIGGNSQPGWGPVTPVMPCSSLAGMDFSGVPDAPGRVISSAVVSDALGTQNVSFCDVKGVFAPRTHFEQRICIRSRRPSPAGCPQQLPVRRD